jgi:CubicO group peptidase (beta-lactamase class C family)
MIRKQGPFTSLVAVCPLGFAQAFAADAPRQAGPASPAAGAAGLAQRVQAFLERAEAAGFSGSVLVVRDGGLVLDRGFGLRDRESKQPNRPSTVHAIGSITKSFTAAATLKLCDQGQLSLADTLAQHFDEVPADKAAITLHQLLTHSAGFPGAIGDDYERIEREAFVKLALATPLQLAPGKGYEYSNVGYSLLAAVLERVTGKTYEQALRELVLEPAGLAHTGYRLPDWSQRELAVGYGKRGQRWGTMLDHPWAEDGPYWHLRGNGGLLSTTHDLVAWIGALRGGKVLSPDSTAKLFAPHVAESPDGSSHYGYGWALFTTPRATKLITHNGGNGIQFADVLCYADEEVSVALCSNASPRGMQDLAWEIGRMCFDPAYEPKLRLGGRRLAGLPEGAAGDRLRSLCERIGGPFEDGALRAWLEANLGPGFLKDRPMEKHLSVFRTLCADIGANRVDAVEQLGPEEFELRLCSLRDQGFYRLTVQLRPSDFKIAGLAVERE